MNSVQVQPFLAVGVVICAIMAVVSSLRYKSRGVSAYIMAFAFAVLGAAMLADFLQWPTPVMVGLIIVLVVLLGADFAARSAYQAKKDRQ